jgi:hypothetical protein
MIYFWGQLFFKRIVILAMSQGITEGGDYFAKIIIFLILNQLVLKFSIR